MSTLRITNIEAKADPSSPTVDEKIKLTNSNGDILVHIDGKTSGITTIGINTTAGNIKFDQNSNVVVTGIITATKFVGTIEPTTLTVGGDLTIPDKIVHTGDTNTSIRFPAADTITAETAGSERLRIDANGHVGVDCTPNDHNNFTRALDVNGPSGAAVYMRTNDSTSNCFIVGNYGSEAYINNVANGNIRFYTQGTERLRIDSSGRFLVGTTSADSNTRLHVSAAENTSDPMATDASIVIANTQNAGNNEAATLKFNLGNTNTASISAHYDTFSAGVNSSLRFYTQYQSGFNSPAERMRITSNGKVGINQSTPQTTFHSTGTTNGQQATFGIDDSGLKISTFQKTDNDAGVILDAQKSSNGTLTFATTGTERLRIDSSGRILVGGTSARTNFNNGTASPQIQIENALDGNKSSIALIHNENNTGDSSAINFGKTRGGAAGANSALNQTGDRLGTITFQGNDGTEFVQAASIEGLLDGTPGANDMPGRLVFSTCADGGSSPQERMRIDKDGKLFVKNSFSDSARNVVIQIECSGQGRGRILSGNSDTDPATLGASSDRRLKTNIRNYTGGLERIRQIPVKIYDEVNTSATDVISWVADEVAPIFPEAVIGEADAVDDEGNPEYQILSSLKFFPDLVQCVQTLITKVETLETQNADLLARVTTLEG